MTSIKYYILSALLFIASSAFAQEADTLNIAADSLRNVVKEEVVPVKPVRTLGKVAVIDTLPTGNSALSIVLFNDNTWRYILAEDYKNDPEVFNDHWDTTNIHAYKDVELNTLPEATAIRLVDSLESYHYPYIGRITSRYGPRKGRAHQGLDLGLKTGDPIYATFDGKVRISKAAGDYGNLVVIRHNNGLETYYAHLSQRDVEVGDWVVAGQQIHIESNGAVVKPYDVAKDSAYGKSGTKTLTAEEVAVSTGNKPSVVVTMGDTPLVVKANATIEVEVEFASK